MGTNTRTANGLLIDAADCLAQVKRMTGKQYVLMTDDEVDKLRAEIEQLTTRIEEMQPLLGKQKTEIERLEANLKLCNESCGEWADENELLQARVDELAAAEIWI